jgi:hypothetical protein
MGSHVPEPLVLLPAQPCPDQAEAIKLVSSIHAVLVHDFMFNTWFAIAFAFVKLSEYSTACLFAILHYPLEQAHPGKRGNRHHKWFFPSSYPFRKEIFDIVIIVEKASLAHLAQT